MLMKVCGRDREGEGRSSELVLFLGSRKDHLQLRQGLTALGTAVQRCSSFLSLPISDRTPVNAIFLVYTRLKMLVCGSGPSRV